MAVSSGLCVGAKLDFLTGVHQKGDCYKIALYGPAASLTPLTEEYTKDGEVQGKGYVAGGQELQGYHAYQDGTQGCVEWTKATLWKTATIKAVGGLIYNATRGNRAVMVVDILDDFGNPVVSTNGEFRLDAGYAVRIG